MDPVRDTIAALDRGASNFGYSNNFGLIPGGSQPVNYSVNQQIAGRTAGCSTMQITISVARTGTGSGNSADAIYLFGGDAFSNTSVGYNAVSPAPKVTALAYANNKNVITFRYDAIAGDAANSTLYTVTLTTKGEYPFVLNSLSGLNKMQVKGIQISIADVAQSDQLTAGMQTFFLDEFGKATTDDLTTPPDLYQFSQTGVFIPYDFEISGKRGIVTNVLNVNAFSVNYFMYVMK